VTWADFMSVSTPPDLTRITTNPGVRSGKACVRDTRVTVQEILQWLASGATDEEILNDYPYLEREDFKAVFAYAATHFTDARVSGL